MTKTRILVLSVLVLLCGAVSFLFFVEYREFLKRGDVGTPEPAALQEEEVSTKEEVLEPVTHLTGVIEEISENAFILGLSPLSDLEPKKRTVAVEADTVVVLVSIGDAEAMKVEMEKFDKEMATYGAELKRLEEEGGGDVKEVVFLTPPTLPTSQIKRKEGSFGDLKVGQEVSVLTANDVRTLGEFSAVSVEVIPESPKPWEVTGQIKSVPVAEQNNL